MNCHVRERDTYAEFEPHPDAELLRLGQVFGLKHQAWLELWWVTQRNQDVFSDACAPIDYDHPYSAIVHDALRDKFGHTASDDALDQVDAIATQIRVMPAKSVAGLAVKARVAMFNMFPADKYIGLTEEEMDWPAQMAATLVREIERMAEGEG